MDHRLSLNVPLNRVEGDLEIRAEVDGGVVTDARACGTLYRGFEAMMVGRAALDGLVITPRICGMCSTAHLSAAARALDMIAGAAPPPSAVRIRNVALMTEQLQSDLRQMFLMFTADLVNERYARAPLFEEAVRRYEPFKGRTVLDTIRETRKVLEILVIVGGQWPHSSFIVPGGVVSVLSPTDLMQCRLLLRGFRDWYERRVLGCPLGRWQDVRTAAGLDEWLEESEAHRDGDLGFCLRYGRSIGLDRMGRGVERFVSFGSLDLPDGTGVQARGGGSRLVPAGFASGHDQVRGFDERKVTEHVASSWFADGDGDGRHPMQGETRPYATGQESGKYSWAKAPRYEGLAAETGPLAEAVIARDPLFVDLVRRDGASALVRAIARLARAAEVIPAMEAWLAESAADPVFYRSPGEIPDGEGSGLVEASRGALGHWLRVERGAISHYQIVSPTTWNASPRDGAGARGPMEEALVGTTVQDAANPVELGHVVRSFDPCLVCTVHALRRGRPAGHRTVGLGL